MTDIEKLAGQITDALHRLDNALQDTIPNNAFASLAVKMDHMLELQQKQIQLLKIMSGDRCTCGKNKIRKKELKELKEGKEKKHKKEKKDH